MGNPNASMSPVLDAASLGTLWCEIPSGNQLVTTFLILAN
jgi:hypothetical protein